MGFMVLCLVNHGAIPLSSTAATAWGIYAQSLLISIIFFTTDIEYVRHVPVI
jgi:hypothetical protein